MKFLPLIWSNLKRRKLRTALTLLSILVAFLLFGLLCTVKSSLTGAEFGNRLMTRNKVAIILSLPLSYTQRIASTPGVDAVVHQSWFGGIYQEPKNFFPSIVVQPDKYLEMFPEFILPEAQKQAWLKTRNGAIVGKTTADRFGWKVGDHVPLTSPIWGQPANQDHWDFEICGIFTGAKKTTDTSQFFFNYAYFDEARQRNKGEVGWFAVRLKDPAQSAEMAKTIDEEFANSPYETKTEAEGAMAAGFASQLGNTSAILMAVVSAVFFTILLVAGNTMSQSVRERIEELGVLKAMGFTNGRVLFLVLAESCVIALLGGLAGLGAAVAIVSSGNPVPSVLPRFFLPMNYVYLGIALAVGLGFVAGFLPAWQAMRLKIAVALRRNA
jgi:putative ABC transport system permease protein